MLIESGNARRRLKPMVMVLRSESVLRLASLLELQSVLALQSASVLALL